MRKTPSQSDDAGLDELLCFAVHSAGLAFGRLYRPLLDAVGLTYVQYVVLVALWSRDERTVGELCEALFLTTSTLTPVLQKLEGKGLVRRERTHVDERVVHVLLTAEGLALKARTEGVYGCIQSATGLDLEAMQDLRSTITALRERLLEAERLSPSRLGSEPIARRRPASPTPERVRRHRAR